MPLSHIETIAKNYFLSPKVVEHYMCAVDRIGLWESEKLTFLKYLHTSMHILDLGCGAGRITFNLHALGFPHIMGADLSPRMIAIAQEIAVTKQASIRFEQQNACALTYPPDTFDGIIFGFNGLMQIPHADKRNEALASIYRVLKPGGIFIFTTHDRTLPQFSDYWTAEKLKWDNGLQDPRLSTYGDRISFSEENEAYYIHIPLPEDIIRTLKHHSFQLIETALRSEIAQESERIRTFSDECRFWICSKN